MKRYFFLVVSLLFVSAILEAQSSFNPFLKSRPKGGFTEGWFKEKTINLIEGDDDAGWHKGAREGLMRFMVEEFGFENAQKNYKKIINDSELRDLVSLSGYEVARLHISSGEMVLWQRNIYPGEKALFYKGKPWISTTCGNPIKGGRFSQEEELVVENDDVYQKRTSEKTTKEYVIESGGTGKVIVINNTIPVAQTAAQPVIIYQQPQPMMAQPAVMQQPMYPQAPPPVYYDNGPREVVVKTKPHWVDYANLVLNTVDLGVDFYSAVKQDRYQKENRYAFFQVQNQLLRQQQQPRRSQPRYRNDSPSDFQGRSGTYFTTTTGTEGNTWENPQFTSAGTFTGTSFAGTGSVPPFNYMAQGYGPQGNHYYSNDFFPIGTSGTHHQEIGFIGGNNTSGGTPQYQEIGFKGGNSTTNGGYKENNYNGGNTSNNSSNNSHSNGGW